jgi:hypothetical protein
LGQGKDEYPFTSHLSPRLGSGKTMPLPEIVYLMHTQ